MRQGVNLQVSGAHAIESCMKGRKRTRFMVYAVSGTSAALILLFNGFTRYQTSDSMMPTVVSVLHWTPFFWRQNYYGMFWPWITQLIHNPLVNLAVNNGVCFVSSIASYLTLGWFLFRSWGAVASGAVAVASLLMLASPNMAWGMLSPSLFFCTPLVLGLTALMLTEGAQNSWHATALRLLLASVLMSVAAWYNVSSPLLLGLLALTRSEFWASFRRAGFTLRRFFTSIAVRQVLLLSVGACVGLLLMKNSNYQGPKMQIEPLASWWKAISSTAHDLLSQETRRQGPALGLPVHGCLLLRCCGELGF